MIDWLASVLPLLLAMGGLLGVSAFCSGSEAALFSLAPRDRARLQQGSAGMRAAARLLDEPDRLLSAILFWNLSVNMIFFALASVVSKRAEGLGEAAEFGFAIVSLAVVIFCGEMLPKSIAVTSPMRFAGWTGLPMTVMVRLVAPALPVVDSLLTISRRLLWPAFKPEAYLQIEDLERAINMSTGDAELAAREKGMLQRAVELGEIRIDEWMRPRSRLRVVHHPVTAESLSGSLPPGGFVVVIDRSVSLEPTAALLLRAARPHQLDDLIEATEPMLVVPWSASVAKVLDGLRQQERQVAAVVNEFGEFIGALTQDDILEGIFREPPNRSTRSEGRLGIAQLSTDRWEASGLTSLRRLTKLLDVEPPESRSVTLGGFMDQQLGRLARPGDRCRWMNLEFAVLERRRGGHSRIEITRREDEEESS